MVYDKMRLRKQQTFHRFRKVDDLSQIAHLFFPAQNVSFSVVALGRMTCNAANQIPEVHLNLVDGNFVFPSNRVLGRKRPFVAWAGLCCLPSTTSPFGVFGAMTDTQELASWLLSAQKVVLPLACKVFP